MLRTCVCYTCARDDLEDHAERTPSEVAQDGVVAERALLRRGQRMVAPAGLLISWGGYREQKQPFATGSRWNFVLAAGLLTRRGGAHIVRLISGRFMLKQRIPRLGLGFILFAILP